MGRRGWAGVALAGVALAAVALGRRAGGLSGGVPEYRRSGPADAPVVVTEYSDFQCPRCAKAQPALKALMTRYADRARLEFRHYPLAAHRWSQTAARAAEAAGLQGRFFEYADALYLRQAEWSESPDPMSFFKDYARGVGIDAERWAADVDSPRVAKIIAAEREGAEAVPVAATPTFFINRRTIVGELQLESMGVRFVELELAR